MRVTVVSTLPASIGGGVETVFDGVTDASGSFSAPGISRFAERVEVSVSKLGHRFAPRRITLPTMTRDEELLFLTTQLAEDVDTEVEQTATVSAGQPTTTDLSGVTGMGAGAQLTFPAGAVQSATPIQVGRFTSLPSTAPALGPMLFLGPTGTTFDQPVTIRIPVPSPLPAGVLTATGLSIIRFDEKTGIFEALPTTLEGGMLVTTTTRFSGYGAGAGGVLPVELVSFDATLQGNAVVLAWETASETNNSGFRVQAQRIESLDERFAIDGGFADKGWVDGMGTTTEAQSYGFRVEELEPGRYLFRLRQVDLDGAFEFSPEVEVSVEANRVLHLAQAWPNPMRTRAKVGFTLPRDGHARAELFDVTGCLITILTDERHEAGRVHTLDLDGSRMASGVYLVRLTFEGEVKTQRVVVAR